MVLSNVVFMLFSVHDNDYHSHSFTCNCI